MPLHSVSEIAPRDLALMLYPVWQFRRDIALEEPDYYLPRQGSAMRSSASPASEST